MLLQTLSVIGLMVASTVAVNYCDNKAMHCTNGKHVACNNRLSKGGFGSSCTKPTFIKMSAAIKKEILEVHNKLRNDIALGKISNYSPASNMATMKWDQQLASFAELNVRNCKFEHDMCMNTEQYHSVGQNIAMSSAYPPTLNASASLVGNLVSKWFTDEYPNGKYYGWMNLINKFQPGDTSAHEVLHFTQFVQAKAKAVGCALNSWIETNNNMDFRNTYLVCNYSHGNILGRPVYDAGQSASKCKTGPNSSYKGLCSIKEK